MPLNLSKFVCARPYLYHLTSRDNLPRIQDSGCLESAASLIEAAGCPELLRQRRSRGGRTVRLGTQQAHLRDQCPLHAGNILFGGGWQLEHLVEYLNRHVFFWPGTVFAPSKYGIRHYERYQSAAPVVLRVPFTELVDSNPECPPLFCR